MNAFSLLTRLSIHCDFFRLDKFLNWADSSVEAFKNDWKLIIFFALLVNTNPSSAFASESIRFANSPSLGMPFYNTDNSSKKSPGIISEIFDAISKELNQPVTEIVLSRKRVETALDLGDVDIACLGQKWVFDKNKYVWSESLFKVREVVILHDGINTPRNLNDLKGMSIGTVVGFHYSHELEKNF